MTNFFHSALDELSPRMLWGPLAAAEDSLARLDERLAKSPIRDGFVARTHFADACAALWLEGRLVPIEDLVLHDARMDVRAPTHEATRAHAVLRARRRIAGAEPDWALSPAGLDSLRGRTRSEEPEDGGAGQEEGRGGELGAPDGQVPDEGEFGQLPLETAEADPGLAAAFAALAAANAKAERTLAGEARLERDPLLYDLDWNEDQRLDAWRAAVAETRALPPTLAAAVAAEAWRAIEPLQHAPWLGRLLAAALLRARGKARSHLPCLNEGIKAIPYERRRAEKGAARLAVELEAIAAAAEAGLKAHDRWLAARALLARKLAGRRSTSRLPALLDYALSRPIVSAGMIAAELGVTPRAAQNLVADLGLREATGRGRYRAWGIL